MKKLYTSNYARHRYNPRAIAISKKPEDLYHGDRIEMLAPTWEMIMGYKDGSISTEVYSTMYIDLLKSRNIVPQELVDVIPEGTFFLCFETPKDFCHRHVLAKWLNENAEVEVEEWKNEKEIEESKQTNLVDSLLSF